ncbi:MAG: polysaccharide deacetylase family protein [Verrucomicrobiota bacterium]|nr:polysaccharide deacetylase family protein [Verrucomicrobiota bacterium]
MPLRFLLPFLPILVAPFSPAQQQDRQKDISPAGKDDGTRVSVLGYHEFSSTLAPSQMRIRTATFRKQMEALRNLRLPVIPLEDFLAWKKGLKFIPPRSIVITIDDGWKSVYTDAFPILKEFKFPFTVYLYKNYVDGGGRALTTSMIREMQQHGCSIGSHSVSHPFPGTIKHHARKGEEAYLKFLRREFGESKRFLETKFSQEITTYAYPGGYYTEDMYPVAAEHGYDHLFTVLPGKIRQGLDDRRLPRYIIHGNSDLHFEQATTFKSLLGAEAVAGAVVQTTPYPVIPEPGSRIESRLPSISADLSGLENLDPESIIMRVSGFGRVEHGFDPASSRLSWPVNRRLRHRVCEVNVQWRLKGSSKYESPMRWSFIIEREAAYQVGAGE